MKKKSNEEENGTNVEELLDRDVLAEDYPHEMIEDELRGLGAKPEEIRERGRFLARSLFRKQWKARAQIRMEQMGDLGKNSPEFSELSREQLLFRLDEVKNSSVGQPVTTFFRKRKKEEASEEELRELLREIHLLREMENNKV